jgi:hypothetical protein
MKQYRKEENSVVEYIIVPEHEEIIARYSLEEFVKMKQNVEQELENFDAKKVEAELQTKIDSINAVNLTS